MSPKVSKSYAGPAAVAEVWGGSCTVKRTVQHSGRDRKMHRLVDVLVTVVLIAVVQGAVFIVDAVEVLLVLMIIDKFEVPAGIS